MQRERHGWGGGGSCLFFRKYIFKHPISYNMAILTLNIVVSTPFSVAEKTKNNCVLPKIMFPIKYQSDLRPPPPPCYAFARNKHFQHQFATCSRPIVNPPHFYPPSIVARQGLLKITMRYLVPTAVGAGALG